MAMIALSVAISGGPDSPAVVWLAIPAVTLGARFSARGMAVGVGVATALMLAVTLLVDAGSVSADPQKVLFPLAALWAIAVLSAALMRSDRDHRSEAVLDPLTGLLNRPRSTAASTSSPSRRS